MAVDMKIEVFSVDLFRNLWYILGVKDYVVPRLKNYDGVSNPIACNNAFIDAVLIRRKFFRRVMWESIFFDYEIYSQSCLDFYLYLQDNMNTFSPYSELNIFDKLFVACVTVLEMATTCVEKSNEMYISSSPLCWAMYFDSEYKEEFYNKGGWRGLELHANSYQLRVLTMSPREVYYACSIWDKFKDAINIEYSPDKVNGMFKEKFLNSKSKASCPQCLPLFHGVRMLSGTSDVVSDFELTEGYFQIILRMLSQEELLQRDKDFFQGTKFESYSEIVYIAKTYLEAMNLENSEILDDKKISYEECVEYMEEYQNQNTIALSDRLFNAVDDLDDTDYKCMICRRNLKEVSKDLKSVSDYAVEGIKSVINNTLVGMNLKDEKSTKMSFEAAESKNSNKNDDDNSTNEALQLFFSLGSEPATSLILENLKKKKNASK